jgi:16S rRNA (uracil1498-N3)-methyltransferase
MPRFFVNDITGESVRITGEDARHITKVLRMAPGKKMIVSDGGGTDYLCRIINGTPELVVAEILLSEPCAAETKIPVRLYQAVPKSDKLEQIIQKSVELGVCEITPVMTSRCISRPSARELERKTQRLQRIAYEAAKQSGRGIIPKVKPTLEFPDAVLEMSAAGASILFYEESKTALSKILREEFKMAQTISIMVGSEGGFSAPEAEFAQGKGVFCASLGPRVLRCETAPVCALSVLLYHLGEI